MLARLLAAMLGLFLLDLVWLLVLAPHVFGLDYFGMVEVGAQPALTPLLCPAAATVPRRASMSHTCWAGQPGRLPALDQEPVGLSWVPAQGLQTEGSMAKRPIGFLAYLSMGYSLAAMTNNWWEGLRLGYIIYSIFGGPARRSLCAPARLPLETLDRTAVPAQARLSRHQATLFPASRAQCSTQAPRGVCARRLHVHLHAARVDAQAGLPGLHLGHAAVHDRGRCAGADGEAQRVQAPG